MSNESIGHAVAPAPPAIQHRGPPVHTPEQLAKLYPVIHVQGDRKEIRALQPHDFMVNQINDKIERNLCNLCSKERGDGIHWF